MAAMQDMAERATESDAQRLQAQRRAASRTALGLLLLAAGYYVAFVLIEIFIR